MTQPGAANVGVEKGHGAEVEANDEGSDDGELAYELNVRAERALVVNEAHRMEENDSHEKRAR